MLRLLMTLQAVELAAVVLAGLTGFVELHVWSPAYTYYLLLVLVVLDVVSGDLLRGQRPNPRRLGLRLVGYTLVLAFAHGFARHEPGLVWLAQLVLAPFVIVHLRRLIITLGRLGLVDADVADLLSRRIRRADRAQAEQATAATMGTAAPLGLPEPAAIPLTAEATPTC